MADDPSAGALAEAPGIHVFGELALDTRAYELRRGGRRVRLARQPMQLLVLLVERRGQLVTHEEIASHLWGERAFVETGTGIHSAIRKIRRALRDDPAAPRFVESVARLGYRFVGPLNAPAPDRSREPPAAAGNPETVADGAPAPSTATPPPGDEARPPEVGTRRGWHLAAATLLAAALAVLGWAAWAWLRSSAQPGRTRIVVLRFENLSQEKELDYLAHGIAEETIAWLVQVDPSRLSVVGRTRPRLGPDVGDHVDEEVARELGADYLVEGSMRAEDDRLRLTVKLIRVRGMLQEWVESFDRERGGMLGLERELAGAVAEQIRLRLSPERAATLARRQTRDAAAYDLYLRGRYLISQPTRQTVEEAIATLERATAIDPHYALAWAEIANAHSGSPINSDVPALLAWPRAHAAATRAVEIQPDAPEAQAALGRVLFFGREWPAAEAAVRRTLAIDPDRAEAHFLLGHILSQTGRQAEAVASMAQARRLDPLAPLVHALSAQVEFQGRNFQGALAHARQALVVAPAFWVGHMQLGQALERLGDTEGALAALDHASRLSGGNSKPVALRAYVLARSGREPEARAVLASLEEAARERFVPPFAFALIHLGLDERDAALADLQRAEAVSDVHLVYLPVDPKWDPLRGDPRFEELLARGGGGVNAATAGGVAAPRPRD